MRSQPEKGVAFTLPDPLQPKRLSGRRRHARAPPALSLSLTWGRSECTPPRGRDPSAGSVPGKLPRRAGARPSAPLPALVHTPAPARTGWALPKAAACSPLATGTSPDGCIPPALSRRPARPATAVDHPDGRSAPAAASVRAGRTAALERSAPTLVARG